MDINQKVIEIYKDYDEVAEILQRDSQGMYEFFILIDSDTYDRKLMRELFKVENKLMSIVNNIYNIHYAPIKHVDRTQLDGYTIIFSRILKGI